MELELNMNEESNPNEANMSTGKEKPCTDGATQSEVITESQTISDPIEGVDEQIDPQPITSAFVFISAIPGSTVLINGSAKKDGLKRDVGMIHFAPVGDRKVHPIIDGAMYTDFGMYVTDDPKVAWALNQSILKGNAQYFAYNPNNPVHTANFQPELYAIETPAAVALGSAQ